MLLLLKKLFTRGGRHAPLGGEDPKDREEKLKTILRMEMTQDTLDGRQVTHRRLESLVLATGAGKKETIRTLRAIGARPSSRHGSKIWTLKPKS